MQTCIENAALPSLEPASLPLLKSASLPPHDAAPAWTIRVARPAAAGRNELAQELRGVPKAALRHVFGKVFGTRLWQQNRATAAPAPANAKAAPVAAIPPSASISDGEISFGMLRHLCAEAAATLRERKRVAKSIALTVQFSDGESENVRQSLPQPTNDSAALEASARMALRRMRSNAFVSLKLDVTASVATCASASVADCEARAPLTAVA